MDKIIAVNNTADFGKIVYYVIGEKVFGVRIEQERGILRTAEVRNITQNFDKIADFANALAKGNVTAIMLFGMCDDFLDAGKLP